MILIDELIEYVKGHETIDIIRTNLIRFFGVDETYDIKQLQNLYQSEEFNELNQPLSYFEDCIEDIRINHKQYKMIYDNYLVDERSKDVFTKMLYAKIFMDAEFIGQAYSDDAIYFSESIWKELRPEAYVDCGGYIGDTALHYIIRQPNYSNIYIYEPLKEAYEKCCNELAFLWKKEMSVFSRMQLAKKRGNWLFLRGIKLETVRYLQWYAVDFGNCVGPCY